MVIFMKVKIIMVVTAALLFTIQHFSDNAFSYTKDPVTGIVEFTFSFADDFQGAPGQGSASHDAIEQALGIITNITNQKLVFSPPADGLDPDFIIKGWHEEAR